MPTSPPKRRGRPPKHQPKGSGVVAVDFVDMDGRRELAWRLKVVNRWPVPDIASELGISISQVYADINLVYDAMAQADTAAAYRARPQAHATLDGVIKEMMDVLLATKDTDPITAIKAAKEIITAQMQIAALYGLTDGQAPALIASSDQPPQAQPLPLTLAELNALVKGDVQEGGSNDSGVIVYNEIAP